MTIILQIANCIFSLIQKFWDSIKLIINPAQTNSYFAKFHSGYEPFPEPGRVFRQYGTKWVNAGRTQNHSFGIEHRRTKIRIGLKTAITLASILFLALPNLKAQTTPDNIFYINGDVRIYEDTEVSSVGPVYTDSLTDLDNGGTLDLYDSLYNLDALLFENSSYGKLSNDMESYPEDGSGNFLIELEIGTVLFDGDNTQIISGEGFILFNDLELDANDTLKLESDSITCIGDILFTEGFLDLNGKEINTYYQQPTFQPRTDGTLINERDESRIVDATDTGSVDMYKIVTGNGNLTIDQFESLGIIPDGVQGRIRFKRFHTFDSSVTDTSVGRVFNLVSFDNSGGAVDMDITYINSSDLKSSMFTDSLAVWFYGPINDIPTREAETPEDGEGYFYKIPEGIEDVAMYFPTYDFEEPDGNTTHGRVMFKPGFKYTAAEINCDEVPDIELPTEYTSCIGSQIFLNPFEHDKDTAIYHFYQWHSNNDTIVNKLNRANPVISFTPDENYDDSVLKVWVDVRDLKGCHSSDTTLITVRAPNKVKLKIFDADSAQFQTSMCVGTPFIVVDENNYDPERNSHTWWIGNDTLDETSAALHAVIEEVGLTDINVSYINEYGCVSNAKNWTLYQAPYPEAIAAIDEVVCQNVMATAQNNSSILTFEGDNVLTNSIVQYVWKLNWTDSITVNSSITSNTDLVFETEALSAQNNILDPDLSITFTSSGPDTLILFARSNLGCMSSDTIMYDVHPAANADIDTSAFTNVCEGVASQLFPGDGCANVMDGGYTWTVDPFLESMVGDTINHIFPSSGTFPVTLDVVSDFVCTATTTEIVTIHPNTIADFEFTDHCVGKSSIFYDTLSVGSSSNTWDFGNGDGIIDNSAGNSVTTMYDNAGNFTVKLTTNNAYGCMDSVTKTVEIYPLPVVSFETDSIACINAQDMLFTNYTETGATYHWDFGDNTENNIAHPDKKYSLAGKYYVNLSAASIDGCQASALDSIIIRDVVPASFNPTNASVCQGSLSNFSAVGNLSDLQEVIWKTGNGDVIYRPAVDPNITYTYPQSGSYIASLITVSENNCMDTAEYQVLIHPNPEITINTEGKYCEYAEITLSADGILNADEIKNYTWIYGDGTVPGTRKSVIHAYNQGDYQVIFRVETQQACFGYDTLDLTIEPNPDFPFNATTPTCETSYLLNAGDVTMDYIWHDGSNLNTYLVTESKTCTVTITNPTTTCSVTGSTQVELASEIDPGIDDVVESCGPTALDAVYPQAQHVWSTGDTNQILTINTTGTYWVEITEGDCIGYDTVDVMIHPIPLPTLDNISSSCGGEAVTLDPQVASGTFEWNTGATTPTIETFEPGFYYVTVTNEFGCSDMALTNLTFYPIPIVQLGNDIETCEGTDILLNAGNPGADYLWRDGETTSTLQIIATGEYNVAVTNQWGCTGFDTMMVLINSLPIVDLGGNKSVCDGDNIMLDANVEGQYLWITGEKTRQIEVNSEGFYWVRVTDDNACSAISEPIEVEYREAPFEPFYFDSIEACSFSLLDAGNPNSTYLWSDGNTGRNYLVNESGDYSVEITNYALCTVSDTINVRIKPQANLDLPETLEICEGGYDFITADYFGDDYSYDWNVGSTEQYIRVESEGTFVLDVIHDEGCISTDSTFVSFIPAPEIDLGEDILMCANSGLALNAGNPGSLYTWGSTTNIDYSGQILELADTGTYWVYVMLPNGCTGRDTVNVLFTGLSIEPLYLAASQIAVGDTVRFVDLSVPEPDTYFWDFGDMVSSEEKEPMHIYYQEGVYSASLTVGNGTCNASITKDLTVKGYNIEYLKKLAKEMEKHRIDLISIVSSKVYPNPASEYVTIELEISKASDIAMYLFGMNGQLVKMEKFDAIDKLEYSLDVSGLYQGLYFLRVSTVNEVKTFKILVIR